MRPTNLNKLFNKDRQALICRGTGCESQKAKAIYTALETEVKKNGLAKKIEVKFTGCHGFCQQGPTVMIEPQGTFYCQVTPEDVPEIVDTDFKNGDIVERLLFVDKKSKPKKPVQNYEDIDYFKPQQRVVLRNCGFINPEDIDDYLKIGGYEGIKKALDMSRKEVIEEVKLSGLRGRGGAGFPTGLKWEFCHNSPGDQKYLICNADEGDPGAFMDRGVLEADPHSVLEGMMIGAYAIGATKSYVYVRAEYPLAYERVMIAIKQAQDSGFLGKNIFGSGFDFEIKVKLGAGAFVCGEETALMASVEGRRGMPRPRPPFPAVSGLFDKPTNINNVETFANLPVILTKGGKWFAGLGTESSKGTKVFALAGKITNSGLVEIPMGTPLKTVVQDIGGGIPNRRKFKAAQTGGPSGGAIPAVNFDIPIDYEHLAEVGSIMGSGGLIITDETTCMVDMAKFFLSFTQKESCGKCVPCRLGTKKMLEILTDISKGQATLDDFQLLQALAEDIKVGSLCGLGQTAPNPVLSAIKYFKDEYETHILDQECPARVCIDLIKFEVNLENCTKCGLCFKACPAEAVAWKKKETAFIDNEKCVKCRACILACRFHAID
jgi:NADH-quinone oxidoreductase subunit F/NADP-reducing hydrogenase subunit HndC